MSERAHRGDGERGTTDRLPARVLANSWAVFAMPFSFDASTFDDRVSGALASSLGGGPVWSPAPGIADEFVGVVASGMESHGAETQMVASLQLRSDALSWMSLGSRRAAWRMETRRGEVTAFRFRSVDAVLFRGGIGFVLVRAQPESSHVEAWLHFIHHFRFSMGHRAPRLSAVLKRRSPAPARDDLPLAEDKITGCSLEDVLRPILQTFQPSGSTWPDGVRPIYTPGLALTFEALLVELPEAAPPDLSARIAYLARNFFHPRQGFPGEVDDGADRLRTVSFAPGEWFHFSLGGGGFIAFDPPDQQFYRETLPMRVRTVYLNVFIFALYQRFALLSFSERLSREWLSDPSSARRARAIAELNEALFEFSAWGRFVQVSQGMKPHECYARWLELFQVEALYRQVRDELAEMGAALTLQVSAEREHGLELLTAVATLFALAALVLSYLGINLRGITSSEGVGWWLPASAVTFVTIVLASLWLVLRSRDER